MVLSRHTHIFLVTPVKTPRGLLMIPTDNCNSVSRWALSRGVATLILRARSPLSVEVSQKIGEMRLGLFCSGRRGSGHRLDLRCQISLV